MRTILFAFLVVTALLLETSSEIIAQVGISTDNSPPDNSAMLDVISTSKGFLPPKMTTAQINAIVNPAEGLMVYNTSLHCPVFYNGTGWKITDGRFYIGASFGGGIVFYVDGTGQHGLIAATSDQSTQAIWGCSGTLMGTSTTIGSGQSNTTAIVNGCSTAGIAARICDDLVLNGYDDWFLPSKDELNQMYLQKSVIGVFANFHYWSSSEYDADIAWHQHFSTGSQPASTKDAKCYVRAVRAF